MKHVGLLPEQPMVVYEEGGRSGTLHEDWATVARRRENYDLLRAMALSPHDSEAVIQAMMKGCSPCRPPWI